jgi:cation diffusion facilitator CzcD-associated flavoprotein CzcO
MLIDVLKHPPAPDVELTADVCVIGAGAAGLTLI